MTIVVGYTDKTGTWLAADKRVTAGNQVAGNVNKIVVANPDIAYGICGTLRDLNIVKHLFSPPQLPAKKVDKYDCERYLVGEFIPTLIQTLDSQGRISTGEEDEGGGDIQWSGNLLVCLGPHLFTIYNDFAVIEHPRFAAIGSGSSYAQATFSSMENDQLTPEEKCKRAVKVASVYDTGCDSHVEIVKMK